MNTFDRSVDANAGHWDRLTGPLKAIGVEVFTLIEALLQPSRILGEVEQMRALLVAANACNRDNPAQAAQATALRRQASRIGLR